MNNCYLQACTCELLDEHFDKIMDMNARRFLWRSIFAYVYSDSYDDGYGDGEKSVQT